MSLSGKLFQYARRSSLGYFLRTTAQKSSLLSPIFKFAVQRAIDYKYPRSLNIEPTSYCNLKCVMCPRDRTNKKDGYIEMKLFRKIVDEAQSYGPRSVVLHKDGEPLLHKEIIEMIKYIKYSNRAHNILISSNGLLLNDELSRELVRSGLDQLHLSIGAVNAESYKKVRGGDLNKLEEKILRLIEIKKEENSKTPELITQIIKMPQTVKEVDNFRKKWKKLGMKVRTQELRHWAGGIEGSASKTAPKKHPCHALWFAPSINWDGKVSACCFDWDEQVVIGDINTHTLSEIWQSKAIEEYRKFHINGEYSRIALCSKCDHYLDYSDLWFWWQKSKPKQK